MRPSAVLAVATMLLSAPAAGGVQGPSAMPWLEEINRDIWRPFVEGVATYKHELYLGVRSKDYIRLQADSRFFLDHDDYVDDTRRMMAQYAEQGARIDIEMRFTERIVNGESASERGIMKVTFTTPSSEARVSYAPFHAISRRERGTWKVLVDYFAADPADALAFARARAMTDLEPFKCYMTYPDKKQHCGQ